MPQPGALLLVASCIVAHVGVAAQSTAMLCSEDEHCNYEACAEVECFAQCDDCVSGVWRHECMGGICVKWEPYPNSNGEICGTNYCPRPRFCPRGQRSTTGYDGGGSAACVNCVAGTFMPDYNHPDTGLQEFQWNYRKGKICFDCPVGKYAGEGASYCQTCPTDSSSPARSESIADCACNPGHVGLNGGRCNNCAAGTYKDTWGSDPCTQCPTFAHSPAGSGAVTACVCNAGYAGPAGGPCSVCEAGKFTPPHATGTCTDCAEGTYSAAAGATECSLCPSNAHSPTGSSTVLACQCNSGYSGPDGGPCAEVQTTTHVAPATTPGPALAVGGGGGSSGSGGGGVVLWNETIAELFPACAETRYRKISSLTIASKK